MASSSSSSSQPSACVEAAGRSLLEFLDELFSFGADLVNELGIGGELLANVTDQAFV
jgi:hypothetical protein